MCLYSLAELIVHTYPVNQRIHRPHRIMIRNSLNLVSSNRRMNHSISCRNNQIYRMSAQIDFQIMLRNHGIHLKLILKIRFYPAADNRADTVSAGADNNYFQLLIHIFQKMLNKNSNIGYLIILNIAIFIPVYDRHHQHGYLISVRILYFDII